MHQVDKPTLEYAKRLYPDIIGWTGPLHAKDGNPHFNTTRFVTSRGTFVSVFSIKPVYYEAHGGFWRPLSEITEYHGNRKIKLNNLWRNATIRYIDWLTKRQSLFGAKLLLPTPFGDWHIQELARPNLSIGLTTTTVYPDPSPESTTVDGEVGHGLTTGGTSDWTSLVNQTGNDANDNATGFICGYIFSASTTNNWRRIYRGIALFNTSSISVSDTITSATLSVYGSSKSDGTSNVPDTSVFSSNPASNTAVVSGDFDSLGTTSFATAIAWNDYVTSAYNNFTLNASGLSNITKGGVSKFGLRNKNYDADYVKPTNWTSTAGSDTRCFSADETGTTKDPKLVVEHTAAGGSTFIPRIIMY